MNPTGNPKLKPFAQKLRHEMMMYAVVKAFPLRGRWREAPDEVET